MTRFFLVLSVVVVSTVFTACDNIYKPNTSDTANYNDTESGVDDSEDDAVSDSNTETTPNDDTSSNCEGYEIEVIGSDYMDSGWQCLPARPYFSFPGVPEIVLTNIDVVNMTWLVELSASPEADIEMDVMSVEMDFVYNDTDWVETLKNEPWRWSAIADDGTELAIGAVITWSDGMTMVVLEPNAGWDPMVVIPANSYRHVVITLDTVGLDFAQGDSVTASFDNYQTWESTEVGIPRISTDHDEFPSLGDTYEIVD